MPGQHIGVAYGGRFHTFQEVYADRRQCLPGGPGIPMGMQSQKHHFGTVSPALDAQFYPDFSAGQHGDLERQALKSRNQIKGALIGLRFEALRCVGANQQISASLLHANRLGIDALCRLSLG
jgi:hypothetical protein